MRKGCAHSRSVNVPKERVAEDCVEPIEVSWVKVQVLVCIVTEGHGGTRDIRFIDVCDIKRMNGYLDSTVSAKMSACELGR